MGDQLDMFDDLTDASARFHKGADTSRAAHAQNVKQDIYGRQAKEVLGAIVAAGETGLTCKDVEVALSMAHQSASSRISSLLKAGAIVWTGRKRATVYSLGVGFGLAKKTRPQRVYACRTVCRGVDVPKRGTGRGMSRPQRLSKSHIRVLRAIDTLHGGTVSEVHDVTHMPIQTVSAKVRELVLAEKLKDSGVRRPTPSGRPARVYVRRAEP